MAVTFLTNEDESRYVKSVNGATPDESGNVEVGSGGNADDAVLIVNITDTDVGYAASHYASEIKAHFANGGYAVGRYGGLVLVPYEIGDNFVSFSEMLPGGVYGALYVVYEDKVNRNWQSHLHDDEYVKFKPQTLTEEQKAQARENIGAVTMDEVLASLPVGEGVKY